MSMKSSTASPRGPSVYGLDLGNLGRIIGEHGPPSSGRAEALGCVRAL
jgi:hypothetical protein